MRREPALKIVLVIVGLLFTAAIFPITMSLWHRDRSSYGDTMMLSLYFVLGILLLMAVRNPAENRSLIAFAAWSSFAHAAVMTVMSVWDASDQDLLIGVAILTVIGVVLLVLAPRRRSPERVAAVGA